MGEDEEPWEGLCEGGGGGYRCAEGRELLQSRGSVGFTAHPADLLIFLVLTAPDRPPAINTPPIIPLPRGESPLKPRHNHPFPGLELFHPLDIPAVSVLMFTVPSCCLQPVVYIYYGILFNQIIQFTWAGWTRLLYLPPIPLPAFRVDFHSMK